MEEIFLVIKAVNGLKDTVAELSKKFEDLSKAPVFAPGPEFLNEDETCEYLYISKRTLANLRLKHIIPHIKTNRKILYRLSDLQEYLETHCLKY